MIIKFQQIFSYWILLWFILYKLLYSYFPEKWKLCLNPVVALSIGIIENILILLIIFNNYKLLKFSSVFFKFFIIFIIIKIIPFIISLQYKYDLVSCFITTIILFIIYNIYLFIFTNYNLFQIISFTINSIINNKYNTPAYHLIKNNNMIYIIISIIILLITLNIKLPLKIYT